MGGAASRFESTDWDTVDGGVKETIDGADPTVAHTIVTLTKQTLLSQRYFDIHKDDEQTKSLLYTSRAIETTEKWFELLEPETKKPLFRVQPINITRTKWIVYSFEPSWPDQAPEDRYITKIPLAMKKQPPIYRKLRFEISLLVGDDLVANVYPFQSTPMDLRGVYDASSPSLQVEEIKSVWSQYQTFIPGRSEELVGYWSWENEATTHKVVMHLAKGADIALHSIMAIAADLLLIDRVDLTVPFQDISLTSKKVGLEERTIVVGIWKDRHKITKALEGSDSANAAYVEQMAENAFVITKGADGELTITESKHKTPMQSIAAMLAKMLVTVGILRLNGIVAMATAASEIEAATRDRPKRVVKEEELSVLVDHMDEGYAAVIASVPEGLGPYTKGTFELSGAHMVWYAPESHVEQVIQNTDVST